MGGAGEIVKVRGGHIMGSTSRKDRHNKVSTAKGPRDRRVRLSAHTAIQFYDVQDRLGYDRPSKAVDWLMKNAKAAIDELAELPAWHPSATEVSTSSENPRKKLIVAGKDSVSSVYSFGGTQNSNFLPPSLDTDAIADTIKSFFPAASSSANQVEDLRLSLQPFQDPIFHQHSVTSGHWAWNAAASVPGGYEFDQGQLFAQRRTLQFSNLPLVRPWLDSIEHQMHQSSCSIGCAVGGESFPGFRIPARIMGNEEHDGRSEKTPSSSCASHR